MKDDEGSGLILQSTPVNYVFKKINLMIFPWRWKNNFFLFFTSTVYCPYSILSKPLLFGSFGGYSVFVLRKSRIHNLAH
jgi:hypothetical protein